MLFRMPAGTGIVTAPATGSLHDRCLQDLALLFQGQNLQGTSQPSSIGSNVYVRMYDDSLSDVNLPAIAVCTEGPEEILDTAENFQERCWGYSCAVLFLLSESRMDPNVRPDVLAWRHQLMEFVDELPLGVLPFLPKTPECWNLVTRPRSIWEEWQKAGVISGPDGMLLVSSFVVVCYCNELRVRATTAPPYGAGS